MLRPSDHGIRLSGCPVFKCSGIIQAYLERELNICVCYFMCMYPWWQGCPSDFSKHQVFCFPPAAVCMSPDEGTCHPSWFTPSWHLPIKGLTLTLPLNCLDIPYCRSSAGKWLWCCVVYVSHSNLPSITRIFLMKGMQWPIDPTLRFSCGAVTGIKSFLLKSNFERKRKEVFVMWTPTLCGCTWR